MASREKSRNSPVIFFSYAAVITVTRPGHTPAFPGAEHFTGRIVHPQKWTGDIEYTNKQVLVIGSGATAVTLVPEMAKTAAHVTMLQRSPTNGVARPERDNIAEFPRRNLPPKLAHGLIRWKNVLLGMYFYRLRKRDPARIRSLILKRAPDAPGDGFDVRTTTTVNARRTFRVRSTT